MVARGWVWVPDGLPCLQFRDAPGCLAEDGGLVEVGDPEGVSVRCQPLRAHLPNQPPPAFAV